MRGVALAIIVVGVSISRSIRGKDIEKLDDSQKVFTAGMIVWCLVSIAMGW